MKIKFCIIILSVLLFFDIAIAENKAQQHSNNVPSSYASIRSLKQAGKILEAKSAALKHLQQYPNDVDVMLLLAIIYYQEYNLPQSYTLATQIIQRVPKYLDARILLIRIELARNNKEAALTQLKAALPYGANNQELQKLQQQIYATKTEGKITKAEQKTLAVNKPELDYKAQQLSNKAPSSYTRIHSLKQAGKIREAKSAALKHLQQYPNDSDVMLLLAIIYYQEHNLPQAYTLATQIIQRVPKYLDARILLIRIELARKNKEAALTQFKAALPYGANNQELQKLRQQIYATKIEKKITKVQKKTLAGNKPKLDYKAIQALKNAGKVEEAEIAALKYLKQLPNDYDVMLVLGSIYYQKQKFKEARILAEKILKKVPKYEDARVLLIRIELASKDSKKALEQLKKGLSYSPKSQELLKIKPLVLKANKKLSPQEQIQAFIDDKKLLSARLLAQTYLCKNPCNDYVRFLLGQIYTKEKNDCMAKNEYKTILTHNPLSTQVRNALFDLEKKDSCIKALDVIGSVYCYQPCNPELIMKRAQLYYEDARYYHAADVSKTVLKIDPTNKDATKLLKEINSISPRYLAGFNELGFVTEEDHVSDLHQFWNYSTLYYNRFTAIGRLSLLLNYAYRRGLAAVQEEVDFTPVLGKYVVLDFDVTRADNLNLFPDYSLYGEIFVNIPKLVTLSIGKKYANIGNTYYTMTTGSITKETKDFLLTYRVYRFRPKIGEPSTLNTVNFRRYLGNDETFVGVLIGWGRSPDLNDLLTTNFIVIKNDFIVLGIQYPLCRHTLLINLGADYQHQVFPTHRLRELTGGILGIKWRF